MTLKELKANIREEICNITSAMLVSGMFNTRKRLTKCMVNWWRRGHQPDLIFKIKLNLHNKNALIHTLGSIAFSRRKLRCLTLFNEPSRTSCSLLGK